MIPLVSASAWAGEYEVAEQSAIAGGTGSASTARVDAAAAWFDPAALSDGGGLRLAVGMAAASARIEARSTDPADPWTTRSENPVGTPPHLYASWAGGRFLVGVAANTPFGGGVRWPDDAPVRFDAIASAPTFVRIAPFVGGRVGPVQLAAGVHVDTGWLDLVQATDFVTAEGLARIRLRGTGVGGDLAAWVGSGPVRVGVSYKSRTALPLHGEADFDVPLPFAHLAPDQAVTSWLLLPDRLAVGVGWDGERWRALVDGVRTGWSVDDALVLDFAEPVTADVTVPERWSSTVAVRGGGEVDFGPATVRAGAAVDGFGGGPPPEDTLSAASPDGTRVSGTVGGGVGIGDHVRVDGFAEVLAIHRHASTSVTATPAEYHGSALIGGLTVGARW